MRAALHLANERLAIAASISQDSLIGTTPDGQITAWNRAAEQLFGYVLGIIALIVAGYFAYTYYYAPITIVPTTTTQSTAPVVPPVTPPVVKAPPAVTPPATTTTP